MKGMVRPLGAEFLGTCAFVFISSGAVVVNMARGGELGLVGVALATGFAYAVMVTVTLPVSGGHLNPAVTVALWLTKKVEVKAALLYIPTQLAAAALAALLVRLLLPGMAGLHSSYGAPQISGILTDTQAVAIEALLTLFLVTAFFGTVISSEAPKLGGLWVGLVLAVAVLVGGPLTGAALNPARAFGPSLVSGVWQGHLLYWVGPIIGAVGAGGLAAVPKR